MVGFVHHQHIRDLQDAGFDRLDIIAQPGRLDHQGGMCQAGDIHLSLSDADRFDQDDLKAGRVEHLHHGRGRRRDAAQRAARGHRADEHARVASQVAHADAVSQDGAAGEGAGWVHRHHRHPPWRLPSRRLAVIARQVG